MYNAYKAAPLSYVRQHIFFEVSGTSECEREMIICR